MFYFIKKSTQMYECFTAISVARGGGGAGGATAPPPPQ